MSSFCTRVLPQTTIEDGASMDLTQALDLADFRELDVVVTVVEAATGEAPLLVVEHAAFNEEGGYLAFSTPMAVDLTATGTTWFHADAFTRWVRWRTTGTLSTAAVVTLDVVARR